MGKGKIYAVAKGRCPGIYRSWEECQKQVSGFKGAVFKSFGSEDEANAFVKAGSYDAFKKSLGPAATAAGATSGSRQFSTWTATRPLKRSFTPSRDVSGAVSSLKLTAADFFSDLKDVLNEGPLGKRSKSESSSLKKNEDGFVIVYTDGACSANGSKKAKAGLGVFWEVGHEWNVAEPVSGENITNNAGEIQAITKAVTIARREGIEKLCIRTDSKFTIDCVTKWLDGWKRNGWKKADKKDVKNKVDLMELDEALQNTPDSSLHVKFEHVPGHCGIFGNEMADTLANQGARKHPGSC